MATITPSKLKIKQHDATDEYLFSLEDMTGASSSNAGTHGFVPAPSAGDQEKYLKGDGTWSVPSSDTDTKNTAGSTNSTDKLFIVGAKTQDVNPQTYSRSTAYVGTDGCLYSNSTKVLTEHQDISGKADLASPAFTGIPTAPTATEGTNTTQVATTAFVKTATDGKLDTTNVYNGLDQTSSGYALDARQGKALDDDKAPKDSPVFTGSISLGRKANTTVGAESVAVGSNVTASGSQSYAEGSWASANGDYSHAEGYSTAAIGSCSHAEGNTSEAYGSASHAGGGFCDAGGMNSFAHGYRVNAYGYSTFAFGKWNVQDVPDWKSGTNYAVDDTVVFNNIVYKCKTANSDNEFTASKWTNSNDTMTYAEIVGNGTGSVNRSNARVLDWDGNERLKGNLYVGANNDGTGGSVVATASTVGDLSSLTTSAKTSVVAAINEHESGISTLTNRMTEMRTLESIGSVATISALETALDTALTGMDGYTNAVFRVQFSSAASPFAKTTYVCRLSKAGSNGTYASALFEALNTTGGKYLIKGTKATTWNFALIPRESDVDIQIDAKIADKVNTRSNAQLHTLHLNNTDATADVITFGGGDSTWGSSNVGGIVYNHSTREYIFRAKGVTNRKNEDYRLPVHSDGSDNVSYYILTTKGFPFVRGIGVSPGGTTAGDGTNKITFSSPEENRHCLICFADKFTNIFCPSNSGATVYSGTIPSGWTLTRDGLNFTLTRDAVQAFRYTLLWM